ncbi:zf-HC2 domain-containing protein [Thermodesulfobacteriota bacterium]
MMRQCKQYRKHLPAFLDGELTEALSRKVQGHMDGCDSCRLEAEQLRLAVDALLTWEPVTPSADYDRVFWQKIQRVRQQQRKEQRPLAWLRLLFNTRYGLAASAALALCMCVLTVLTLRTDSGQPQGPVAADMELLLNMEVIESSEALEHFELIQMLDVLQQEIEG